MLNSVCTVADHHAYDELVLMLRSLSLFTPIDAYVAGDKTVLQRLRQEKIRLPIHEHELLAEDLQAELGNPDFMRIVERKPDILEIAMSERKTSLFLDADMLFIGPIWGIDLAHYDLSFSRHMILAGEEKKFGTFNSGYVGAAHPGFPAWWREQMPKSKFVDQECLVHAPGKFKIQELGIQHNFGWWRLNRCDPKQRWWRLDRPENALSARRRAAFSVRGDQILYEDEPLVSFHTHIKDRKTQRYQVTNDLAVQLLTRSTNPKHKMILSWL